MRRLLVFLSLLFALSAGAQNLDAELLAAARVGDAKKVAQLLAAGANPRAQETERPNVGRTPLHYAAGGYRGGPGQHEEVARLLLAKGADVNAHAQGGYTPLHVASGLGNVAMVSLLLEHGADANAKDARATPLVAAVVQGQLAVVRLLLKHGANVNAGGDGPMSRAIDFIGPIATWYPDHDAIFLTLIEVGADLKPREKGGNPLWSAVSRQRVKVALAMIAKGAPVDGGIVEAIGMTGQREIAETLARQNLPIFTGKGVGSTLLHGAVCNKDAAFLAWTLERTPDVNARGHEGQTPMHMAARCSSTAGLSALIRRGGQVNAADAKGRAPLAVLFGADLVPAAKLLLDAGADPNGSGDDARTALMTAVYTSNAELARLIIARGADVNRKDRWGRTALHEAARLYKPEVAEIILAAKGIRVDERDEIGWTALHRSAQNGGPEMVRMLLARGADKTLRTPKGVTALELAEEQGGGRGSLRDFGAWNDVVKLLR